MAGIFTRQAVTAILGDENLTTDDRLDRIMSLRGRDLDDGYVTKAAAKAAQDSALEAAKADWEKNLPKPDVKDSEEYKQLQEQYQKYQDMQNAKESEAYAQVKKKFFEMVYGMVDRKEGAQPVEEQLAEIRRNYEEYFQTPASNEPQQPKNTPQYSQQPGRSNTNEDSEEEKIFKQISQQWQ